MLKVKGSIPGIDVYFSWITCQSFEKNDSPWSEYYFICWWQLVWTKCKTTLMNDMQIKLEWITKWLRDSGLQVNEGKTKLCLFHRKDAPPQITINTNNKPLTRKNFMNVLGVAFDNKLNWHKQTELAVSKSRKSLHAIKSIRKHFSKKKLSQLLKSNYYSVLYYNSEIWHIPSSSRNSKKNYYRHQQYL